MEGKMPNAGNKLVIETVPWTNGDAIRAMTDEELAYRFATNECGVCPLKEKCFAMEPIKDCEDMWLDWLREEVTDG